MGRRIATVVVGAALFLALVGCGGGGDGVDPRLINLSDAMATPDATNPAAAGQTCQDALEALQDSGPPEDTAALRAELALWVARAQANPNDTACQVGLVLAILAVAGHNGAYYLGYDPFEGLDTQATAAMAFGDELSPSSFVNDALKTASLKGLPQMRGGAGGVQPMDDGPPPVSDLQQWRAAVKQHLLPALQDAVERLGAIADLAGADELLLSLELDGGTHNLYAADFHCLVAALQLMRCGALMVSSVDPNYGSYNWDLNLDQRDANSDGILTVAEYAPPAPFGNIDGAPWTQAGACLRDAVTRLRQAIADRQVGDPNEVVNQALDGDDPQALDDSLAAASGLLAGQVNVTVQYGTWPADGTAQIPFNLRELWDNPPTSFRNLLPPLLENPPGSGEFAPDMDSLPDRTFSGLLPDPDAIENLMAGDYDRMSICYGDFCIGDAPWLP